MIKSTTPNIDCFSVAVNFGVKPTFGLVIGGAKGDRTPDLMTASHALSQLSYGPLSNSSIESVPNTNNAVLLSQLNNPCKHPNNL